MLGTKSKKPQNTSQVNIGSHLHKWDFWTHTWKYKIWVSTRGKIIHLYYLVLKTNYIVVSFNHSEDCLYTYPPIGKKNMSQVKKKYLHLST